MEAQTEQVMLNLGAILSAGGSSFANVVKTTVLLADMGDFQKVNVIYGETFMCFDGLECTNLFSAQVSYDLTCYNRQIFPRTATCSSLLRSEDSAIECQGGD